MFIRSQTPGIRLVVVVVVVAANRHGRRSRNVEEGALSTESRSNGPQQAGTVSSQAGALEEHSRQKEGAALASRALIGQLHLKHHEPASQPRIDKPQPIPRPTRGINLDPV